MYIEVQTKRNTIKRIWKYRRWLAGNSSSTLKATLGAFPCYSIAAARQWAGTLNDSAERSVRPAEAERDERAKFLTVTEAHEHYMAYVKSRVRRALKPRTILDMERVWALDLKVQIGNKALQEITDDDLSTLCLTMPGTVPIQANRLAGEGKIFLARSHHPFCHRPQTAFASISVLQHHDIAA